MAILPLALVLLTIILPRLLTMVLEESVGVSADWPFELLRFAVSQPIVWPSTALIMGTLLAVAMLTITGLTHKEAYRNVGIVTGLFQYWLHLSLWLSQLSANDSPGLPMADARTTAWQ